MLVKVSTSGTLSVSTFTTSYNVNAVVKEMTGVPFSDTAPIPRTVSLAPLPHGHVTGLLWGFMNFQDNLVGSCEIMKSC